MCNRSCKHSMKSSDLNPFRNLMIALGVCALFWAGVALWAYL